MKKILFGLFLLSVSMSVIAQRYDYDDIYFNPKKDIVKNVVYLDANKDNIDNVVAEDKSYQDNVYLDSDMDCTARIQKFHRSTDGKSLDYMLSSDYTNVIILDEGQYNISIYDDNIDIYKYKYNSNPYYYDYPYYSYYSYNPYYPYSYYGMNPYYGW